MADGIVGTAVAKRFRTGFTGQVFTVDTAASSKPDGTSWDPEPPAVVSGDLYLFEFTPDQAGVWVAEVTDADGRRYRGEYDILAEPSTTFTRVTSGRIFRPADINQLQQRLEELPF